MTTFFYAWVPKKFKIQPSISHIWCVSCWVYLLHSMAIAYAIARDGPCVWQCVENKNPKRMCGVCCLLRKEISFPIAYWWCGNFLCVWVVIMDCAWSFSLKLLVACCFERCNPFLKLLCEISSHFLMKSCANVVFPSNPHFCPLELWRL